MTREKVFASLRRWSEMMLKERPEIFGDSDEKTFLDEDEMTASLQSYVEENDLKYPLIK